MTRGEAATKVLDAEKKNSRLQTWIQALSLPCFGAHRLRMTARFNYERYRQRATPEEMCAFKKKCEVSLGDNEAAEMYTDGERVWYMA
eukprot:6311-Heterococcus_DN1.PRE.1